LGIGLATITKGIATRQIAMAVNDFGHGQLLVSYYASIIANWEFLVNQKVILKYYT
jgi:hypothetical protein